MTAAQKIALETTSAIAIGQATGQRPTGVVIPFPAPENRQEVASAAAEIEEAQAMPTGPASALIERAALARAFEVVAEVIERSSIPILENARLTAGAGTVSITATDLDLQITTTTHAAIDRHFDITIPAKKMKELLKGAPKSEYVAFEDRDGSVSADFEKVRYALNSLPAKDFPDLSAPKAGAQFTMAGADVADGLEAVSGAISTEETRYSLNGVFLHHYDGSEFRMVTTDGHRLYMQKLELPNFAGDWPINGGYQQGVILPRKTVGILCKLMRGKKCPESVAITLDDARSEFRFAYDFGEVTVTSKNVDGTFPDYQRVVPSYSNFPAARFDVEHMADGIKACSLISSERGRAVKLTVNAGGAALDVNNPEAGSAHADLACDWQSDEIEIGFNARYMLDILDVVGDGAAAMHLQDSGSPAVVTGARRGWLAVLMPMRV